MRQITSASWGGLPIHQCEYQPGHPGVTLAVAMLFFWPANGMSLAFSHGSSRRSVYGARGGRFDFLPAGAFVEVTRADRVVHPVIVALPASWNARVCDSRDAALLPEQRRLQFSDRALERLLDTLLTHHALGEPLGPLYTQSVSTMLAHRLLLAPQADHAPAPGAHEPLPPLVRRQVETLIEASLDAPPDVHSLAALAGMGTPAFLRAFKATLGHTLHQYVLHRRIERAKQMLASPQRALTSLALELGFASHSHFTTAFRAHTGVTPSEFRHHGLRSRSPRLPF